MYESGPRGLAVRKSPSMPMLDMISIGGVGDLSYMENFTRCPSGRGLKTAYQRKVKSAISLCLGILLCTIVLFMLVSLDPSKVPEEPWHLNTRGPHMLVTFPYRLRNHALLSKSEVESKFGRLDAFRDEEPGAALDGMGMLFRKGSRGMPELVVAHLCESSTPEDLRLFLRGLHRSGLPARADIVLLFPFRPLAVEFAVVIHEENKYFQKLLLKYQEQSTTALKPTAVVEMIQDPKLSTFNSAAYLHSTSVPDFEKVNQESVWGKVHNQTTTKATEWENVQEEDETAPHYGAIVGFDVQELDPDDALSGFIDSPSMNLRRWICYQILLGMVRHKYRHVFLTEVTGVFILKDVTASLKKKDMGLHLYYTGQRWSDFESESGRKETSNVVAPYKARDVNATIGIVESVYGIGFWNSLDAEDKRKKVISTGMILGGIRPVRSVATAMATEIVRVALLRKSRSSFNVEAVLSYLVHKSSVLGRKVASHLQVHENGLSMVNILPGPPRGKGFDDFYRRDESLFAVLQGLKNEGVAGERRVKNLEALRRDICSSQNDLEIYTDCYVLRSAETDLMML